MHSEFNDTLDLLSDAGEVLEDIFSTLRRQRLHFLYKRLPIRDLVYHTPSFVLEVCKLLFVRPENENKQVKKTIKKI